MCYKFLAEAQTKWYSSEIGVSFKNLPSLTFLTNTEIDLYSSISKWTSLIICRKQSSSYINSLIRFQKLKFLTVTIFMSLMADNKIHRRFVLFPSQTFILRQWEPCYFSQSANGLLTHPVPCSIYFIFLVQTSRSLVFPVFQIARNRDVSCLWYM